MVKALVDTGAAKSAISYQVIKNSGLRIDPVKRRWRAADGPGRGILGQMELVVGYGGSQVRLPEVIVFDNLQVPLILGIEWVGAAKASVSVVNQVGVVTLLDSIDDESFPRGKVEGAELEQELGSDELSENEMQDETTGPIGGGGGTGGLLGPENGGRNLPESSEGEEETDDDMCSWKEKVAATRNPAEGPRRRHGKIGWSKRRWAFHAKSNGCKFITFIQLNSQFCHTGRENGKLGSSTLLPPIPELEEEEVEDVEEEGWLLMIGTLQEGEPIIEKKKIPVKRLKPLRGWEVPSWSKGFIQCKESSGGKKTWMVTAANGLGKGRGWAIPACLITSENGI